jgi:uncharacterized protein GlcG (DUF336 family)
MRLHILAALLVASLGGRPSHAFSINNQLVRRSETRLSSSYTDSLATAAPLDFSGATGTTGGAVTPSAAVAEFMFVPQLSLLHADEIANHVIACCERNEFNPVTVFVLDISGNTILSKRMDGCSAVGSPEFSRAKAYSCIVNKYPSRQFRDRYTADEASAKFCQMTTMVAVSGGQMAPFPGGVVLKLDEYMIGAVGVSGAAGDEDEYCAIRGVLEANLGLTTVPETHSCATVKDQF